MQFLANVQRLTVSGFVIFVPPPPPRPYIHDCLGMVPQTRQAESGLQASHRPGETLQHGRGSPEAQAATLHLIELAALREHLEGVLEETVEVWIRILPARRWALSGRPPATWLATSLNRAEAIQPRRGSTTATCQVFIYMSDATTRAGNQNSLPLPPSSFTAPPCPCPCHFTVGHAAFFFRVTGQRQWRLENTRNFLLLGGKKMLTTGCHRMRNGASVVERKSLEGTLQRVHCKISPVNLHSKPPL